MVIQMHEKNVQYMASLAIVNKYGHIKHEKNVQYMASLAIVNKYGHINA